jgi:hypothetical protein
MAQTRREGVGIWQRYRHENRLIVAILSDKMATTLLYWEDPVASGVIFASVLGNKK